MTRWRRRPGAGELQVEEEARRRARAGDVTGLRALLRGADLRLVVEELERMTGPQRAGAFRLLPRDTALRAFVALDPALQVELIDHLRAAETRRLVADLDPDDRARALDRLPPPLAEELLRDLPERERRMTLSVLDQPEESVGRWASPAFVSLPVGMTAGEALERVRTAEEGAETVYVLPVVDVGSRVVGVVSLRRLLSSAGETPLETLMREPITVRADEDQEVGARLVRDHGAVAVPVVDEHDRLLGLFTVDDAMRVLELEEDEDSARSAGMERLDRPYLTTSVVTLARSRVLWLLVLIVAATLTVNVLDHFEATLEQVVALALFIPLLIGTGGNVGAQSASTMIRALAVDDVRFADLPAVLRKEIGTGLLLGAALALIAYVPARLFTDGSVAVVISVSLVVVCALAASAGGLIPLVARRLGVDPAVVSAPFITTFVDATGLVVYFLVAGLVLGL